MARPARHVMGPFHPTLRAAPGACVGLSMVSHSVRCRSATSVITPSWGTKCSLKIRKQGIVVRFFEIRQPTFGANVPFVGSFFVIALQASGVLQMLIGWLALSWSEDWHYLRYCLSDDHKAFRFKLLALGFRLHTLCVVVVTAGVEVQNAEDLFEQ